MLVRENPKTRAVSVNSLYCVPVRLKVAGGVAPAIVKTSNNFGGNFTLEFYEKASGDPDKTLANAVRISSIELSSKSPFTVTTLNSIGSHLTYKCEGQKVNKITLSRENSVAGNPAILRAIGNSKSLISIADNEDQVDIIVYAVVDSTLD